MGPPMLARLKEWAEMEGCPAGSVRGTLVALVEAGAVGQLYPGGPYVPLKRPDGTPVRLALVDEAPRHDPLIALIERIPEDKRGAAEAYLRFLVEG